MRHPYAEFIGEVNKPGRYLGGEYLSAKKSTKDVDARVVLAFPDVYEIGMSHLGTKILYSELNKNPRIFAERCFAPWVDMEEQLRKRQLPLVSLETGTVLREFDAIGISLQYELTFTNVLTLLDLGRVPLHASDRSDSDPLVIGGGPVASHPEPMAQFFDAFFIGEAEGTFSDLLLEWSRMRREGRERLDALAELATRYSLYVPALYQTTMDPDTQMVVVDHPLDERAPMPVVRTMVENLDEFPFPKDSPVPHAEAIFDRAAVEIARGCTEGCRFCQAGMIYRPVRERSPESIVDSVMGGIDTAGYDETSLTCLSTADFSCVTPLVKEVMGRLREKKVTLSVSSLRAYGLNEEILDEMASMRITGLTLAPEAGTQRMRDVVNKNVTEKQIEESATRLFSRGWHRFKMYFMIGLPTEEDGDVVGILKTSEKMLRIGRQHIGRKAEVTVSVSSHVPKPHTPFQWCAQDSVEEIKRKQNLLRASITQRNVRLKYHYWGTSYIEGIMSRGDRRLGEVIELAWRRGARFDGWDEFFDVDRWREAMDDCGLSIDPFLSTRPVTARLPWDHIDVGLEDGFLLAEYRKAVKNRLSPPCGKVAGQEGHHSTVVDALAETRKLVCYDCGIACDMTSMRSERIEKLSYLHALPLRPKVVVAKPAPLSKPNTGKRPEPQPQFAERPSRSFRIRYAKIGRAAFLGHLDTVRMFARLFRRAGISVAYTRGFHPKPNLSFSPALALGVASLGELMDVKVEGDWEADDLWRRLREVSPEGNEITGVFELGFTKGLGKEIESFDLLIRALGTPSRAELEDVAARFMAQSEVFVERKGRKLDVRAFVEKLDVLAGSDPKWLCSALEWEPTPYLLRARVGCSSGGSVKPSEVTRALGLEPEAGHRSDESGAPAGIVLTARLGFGGRAIEGFAKRSENPVFAEGLH